MNIIKFVSVALWSMCYAFSKLQEGESIFE